MSKGHDDCMFCKFANCELDVAFVGESETAVAFKDIAPSATHHILVVPRQHVSSIDDPAADDSVVDLMRLARAVAARLGIDGSGYRLVINAGPDAGQTVFHLHMHLLGGEALGGFGAKGR